MNLELGIKLYQWRSFVQFSVINRKALYFTKLFQSSREIIKWRNKMSEPDYIYHEEDGDLSVLEGKKIAVIGYGNQGRAQALNLRDSKQDVIIGNREDEYREKAKGDNFEVYDIGEAVKKADIIFMLTPDEDMPKLYAEKIAPNLKDGATINFASGYNIAFGLIKPKETINVIMIAPRMIGVGVRERYLTGEGFYSFITVHQDATGDAKEILLGLAKAVGSLQASCIDVTMKQEAILDLFNEQAFGPAFGRVLLTSIDVLISNGLPPEAVLTEMYLSEEMSYTYKKMAQIGLVKQTNFHSHTSQYGAMSRGARYLGVGKELKERFQKTYDDIESGAFAKEWEGSFAKLKYKVIKFFAMRQKINKIEKEVRNNLGLKEIDVYKAPEQIEELLKKPEIKNEIDEYKDLYEY
ncbi:MAG: ketol-acid reductoisomerase [Candidatus Lokiarchaeota archaeon]|nr:ketol-acid reductoisomerase [Candidatus Lokiarchaeota archaeon]